MKTFRHFVTFATKTSVYMRLEKAQFKKPKEHTVKIDSKTHDKLRHLAYSNKSACEYCLLVKAPM